MEYFFNIWERFAELLKSKKGLLLLFDFDGTLTPIVGEPKKARLSRSVKRYIKKLSRNRRITIGIISGRGLRDIMRLVGVRGIYYAGNHGLEIKGRGSLFVHPSYKKYIPYMKDIAAMLGRGISGIKGAILEYKRLSVSLHYRLVPARSIPRLKSIFKKISAPYIKSGKIRMTTGKKVLELRPPVSWDKGKAVGMIGKMAGKNNAVKVFVGDDITDEDAFKMLKKNDFSIRVVRKSGSVAQYFLKNPGEVRRLLMKITKVVTSFFIVSSISALLYLSDVACEDVGVSLTVVEPPSPTADVRAEEAMPRQDEPLKIETKVYTAKTKDGWEISINRYGISGEGPKRCKAAVILCHGFNINNRFWDIDRRCSLARFLAKNGYDVWAPSLRGSGLSSKPVLSRVRSIVKFELSSIPQMLIKTPFDITKFGWTIDDHIYKDVPAIIDFVKEKSGFDKIYWIGHSMGGIVMFGYLETGAQDDVAGFIPVGSMMVIPQPLTPHLKTIANQKPLLTASLLVNSTVASQFRNFTLGTVKHPIEDMLIKRENMYPDVIFRFFRLCIDDTSAGVVAQFSDSIRTGSITSSDRRYSYTDNMRRVSVPILIMSGVADGFVTEDIAGATYDKVSSKDKGIVIFSKANGNSMDYGHCDLLLGKNSEQDVYPVILKWLDERACR